MHPKAMRVYDLVLFAHSYLRWAVLLLCLAVAVRAAIAPVRTKGDVRLHVILVGVVDTQFLLGILLYVVLSPITSAFIAAPGAGMKEPVLRFFGVEHVTGMLVAIAILHQGRPRKAPSRRRVLLTTILPLLVIFISIPWPSTHGARPLFRSASQSAPAATPATCPPTFSARCASCHGASGAGDGPAAAALRPPPRNFTDPSWGAGKTTADLAALIREGGAKHGLSPAMPAQPDLSDAEIDALVGCVRGLKMKHTP